MSSLVALCSGCLTKRGDLRRIGHDASFTIVLSQKCFDCKRPCGLHHRPKKGHLYPKDLLKDFPIREWPPVIRGLKPGYGCGTQCPKGPHIHQY